VQVVLTKVLQRRRVPAMEVISRWKEPRRVSGKSQQKKKASF
jgi:hypothetical protein